LILATTRTVRHPRKGSVSIGRRSRAPVSHAGLPVMNEQPE
jgi:hypothetical protein